MTSLPLHPAVVHIPLGLAFIMPLLAAGFAWALWTGRVRPRAWLTIVALQAVLFGAGLVASNTGEPEEDRVETIVPHDAIEQHERYAELFVWGTGLTLGLIALVPVFPGPRAIKALSALAVAGTLAVAALGVQVGHAGGQLVYVHNAGAAYATPRSVSAGPDQRPATPVRSDDSVRRRRN